MLLRALAAIAMLGLSALFAEGLRSLPTGLASIALALLTAAIAVGIAASPSPLAIGMGALGALAYAALRPSVPIVAAAVLALSVGTARAMRARDLARIVTQLAVATTSGAAAAWVVLRFEGADLGTRTVALAVAALVASAPFAMQVEDPRTHALLRLAASARGPLRVRLLRAAALRRRTIDGPMPVGRSERGALERAFRTVARLGEARAEAGAVEHPAIDRALGANVDAIARLSRALRSRWISGEAIAGHEAKDVAAAGDRVAAEAAALDEIGGTIPIGR
jgi:hypothetical protein